MVNKTELVFILDESGSMYDFTADTIGGFNATIDKNKALEDNGQTVVTVATFNDKTRILFDCVALADIPTLTNEHYHPDSMTAMYDGIGTTLNLVATRHPNKLVNDEKVIVAITTDGLENASREYNGKTILNLIDKCKANGWEFLFVGANINEQSVANDIGIGAARAIKYNATSTGTRNMHQGIGAYMYSRRMCVDEDTAFYTSKEIITDED